jgi:hypothetical protein
MQDSDHRRKPQPLSLMPMQLRRSMAEIGPVWSQDVDRHARIVFDGYAPLLRAAPRDGVIVSLDLAYGDHQRQKLDVLLLTESAPRRFAPHRRACTAAALSGVTAMSRPRCTGMSRFGSPGKAASASISAIGWRGKPHTLKAPAMSGVQSTGCSTISQKYFLRGLTAGSTTGF